MSDRRIVVQDAAWRRLSIPEDDYDNADANPLNHAHDSHEWDADRGLTVLRSHPARVMDRGSRAQGFPGPCSGVAARRRQHRIRARRRQSPPA